MSGFARALFSARGLLPYHLPAVAGFQLPSDRLVRFRQATQLALNISHLLVDPAVLEPYRRVMGNPARELLVVRKCLFEKFLLERIEPVIEADVGNLGQYLDGMTSLPALALGLFLLFGNQYRTRSQRNCRRHQENSGRGDKGLVARRPAQDTCSPGLRESLHRFVGKISLNFLRQLGRGCVPLSDGFRSAFRQTPPSSAESQGESAGAGSERSWQTLRMISEVLGAMNGGRPVRIS